MLINLSKADLAKHFTFSGRTYLISESCKFEKKTKMTEVTIDNMKYVIITKKNHEILQKKTAQKSMTDKILSIEDARAYSKKIIRQWAAKK